MELKNTYTVIGLMSGTSLDGLDVALCSFTKNKSKWTYKIIEAKTFTYNKTWKEKLQNAHLLNAQEFWKLHIDFGKFSAQTVNQFLKGKKHKVYLIASHGQTIFHQPQNGFTCQIGDGAAIAALTGITTTCDFRSTDVALGGQGAPLVPIGDELLFSDYDACLNIGGIANISFTHKKQRLAFDICPTNLVFNFYANKAGMSYDKGGKLAAKGKANQALLKKLNALSFYKNFKAKSLGREWIDEKVISLLESEPISLNDKLATAIEHSAFQTARVLNHFKIKNVLLTGGGAYNAYFIERIKHYTACKLILPDDKTIQFKEALIFAFLGVLRLRNEVNCLKQVTGASKSNCGGALYNA
ncbi:MAG TPA: anhydro-N-acetylmuramic acid kinase [Bacteroidia bacterium]|jgi:anhydro-N-acetylmuramic acid kinase|nr:anhydro-N-acetylmuramic acid kinase [Bacteroidia bacterium]